ncbi:hypothetical protein TrCOL_g10998 [Triparma columacea]|uniref:Uncharacterized protein n=1 Tax=Triparma columacea TaxID=722753 RepID=A0A9W7GBS9_9STRA|nr:hypothetical protein TrCOL_g10998 [Triparma columacea]
MMHHMQDENSSLNLSLSTPLKSTPGHHRSKSATPFTRTPKGKGLGLGGTPHRRALGDISNKKPSLNPATPGKVSFPASVKKSTNLFPVPSPAPSAKKSNNHQRSKSVSFYSDLPVPTFPSTPSARPSKSSFKSSTKKVPTSTLTPSKSFPPIELSAGRTYTSPSYLPTDVCRSELQSIRTLSAIPTTPTLSPAMNNMNDDDMDALTNDVMDIDMGGGEYEFKGEWNEGGGGGFDDDIMMM